VEYQEWVNANSTIARLSGKNLLEVRRDAMRILCDDLESPRSANSNLQQCRVAAASQYAIHCSPQLLFTMRDGRPNEGDIRALRSDRFKGDAVFSMGRWEFWKEQFGMFAAEDYPEASMALQKMREAEEELIISEEDDEQEDVDADGSRSPRPNAAAQADDGDQKSTLHNALHRLLQFMRLA
jgi:hypothetical protein